MLDKDIKKARYLFAIGFAVVAVLAFIAPFSFQHSMIGVFSTLRQIDSVLNTFGVEYGGFAMIYTFIIAFFVILLAGIALLLKPVPYERVILRLICGAGSLLLLAYGTIVDIVSNELEQSVQLLGSLVGVDVGASLQWGFWAGLIILLVESLLMIFRFPDDQRGLF